MENRMMNWGICAALVTVGFSFWWLNKSWKTELVIDPQSISYEMPRPKAVNPGYDISGRRFVQDLLPGQVAAKIADAGKAPKTPVAKVDPKAAAKKAVAKKTAANSKKKNQFGVRIIGAPANGLSVIQNMQTVTDPGMQGFQNAPQNPAVAETVAEPEEPKRTAVQWKALLMENPTALNTTEFLKAFRNRDVAASDFYSITEELFDDVRADRQKAGFYLLKADVSVKSFTVLVAHYTDRTPEPLKVQIYAVLKTYGDFSRFGILSRLLYSADARVVAMATQVLSLTVASQGVNPQDDGTHPGPAIPPINFRAFLPALTRLAQSENATIAQQAQALLQSIQNLLTA